MGGAMELPVCDMYGTLKMRPSLADVQAARGGGGGNPPSANYGQPQQQQQPQAGPSNGITMYGRDGCWWCDKVKGDFDAAGIRYTYVNSD